MAGMKKTLLPAFLFLLSLTARGQDATAVLAAAAKAMGAASLESIQYSGSGTTYFFGQAVNPTAGWPRMILKSYVADVNYATPAMRQELYRTEPDGSVPFGGNRQIQLVSGLDAWNVGSNDQPVPAVALAGERALQIWLTPHGFIKAAQANRATVATTGSYTGVTFTTPNRIRVTGVINAQNLVERIETELPNVVLGDMPVEVTFANYQTYGDIKFPTTITQRQGGHPILELTVAEVKPNGARAMDVPANVLGAKPAAMRVESARIGEGVWHITGASHHSVLAEFADHLVVVEAPQHEDRSLAVIAEVRKLVPDKPIRYVVNTHQHFDHSGGLRSYAAIGATILTASIYKPYYERVFAAPYTINPDMLAKTRMKPVIEGVGGRRVLSDKTQTLELHVLRDSPHNEGLLVAYFPKDKMLVQADIFTPPPPDAAPPAKPDPSALNLYENIERLKLDVQKIVGVHGRVGTIEELRKAVGK
jgi:glyoxylase-like metal-dependent hydrolase (beta-lactamase superfamily II)